jgi:hypothetical protein
MDCMTEDQARRWLANGESLPPMPSTFVGFIVNQVNPPPGAMLPYETMKNEHPSN